MIENFSKVYNEVLTMVFDGSKIRLKYVALEIV